MRPIYPPASYRTDGYASYPTSTHSGEERIGFFLPFVAGLATGPLLAGGGYGYGAPPPPPISYGPQYGPQYGPSYGPSYGPIYGGPPGYGGGPPRPQYGPYGSAPGFPR